MADPIPTVPLEFEAGRDQHSDGVLGSGEVYSTVKVINLTPYESSEIKTAVITLEKDAFKVTLPGSSETPKISVSSIYGTDEYVQWEPMGDLHEPTEGISPLGSYKLLRVKWDCKVPAGRRDNNYAIDGSVSGPYEYYSEVYYNFVNSEPINIPSFNLTTPVKTALGIVGNNRARFQLSAHGFINTFEFSSGLYGQDKQTLYPDGSSIIPAFRDKIYDRYFREIGNTTDLPTSTNSGGEECLAKEYELHGRIVPELDAVTYFDTETWDSSGNDAPPIWYNFYYELQHNKNIIPFTFMWGVDTLNYDDGTYDPRNKDIDPKDVRINKVSSNHGPRLRSPEYLQYLLTISGINKVDSRTGRTLIGDGTFATPNLFYSNDDVTFSVIGPETVCHASSVNVCAVYYDTVGALNRTILNWFDKGNAAWYDFQVFGINNLPCYNAWVLRGCLLLNNSYVATSLSTEDQNAQNSIRSERTWAIDQNFYDRKLFGSYKNSSTKPPEQWILDNGYDDAYQSACNMMYTMWESPIKNRVEHPYFPEALSSVEVKDVTYYTVNPLTNPGATPITIDLSDRRNPFFEIGLLEDMPDVGFLKGLHEPWAFNPLGLNTRPGVQGSQPGFSNVGGAGINATIGLPDMRAWEACVDLEWNRLFLEANRDGSMFDPLHEYWTRKRFKGSVSNSTISNNNLENVGRILTNNPNYSFTGKSFNNSLEFSGADRLIDEGSIVCYFGTNPTPGGSSSRGFARGYPQSYYKTYTGLNNRSDASMSFVKGLGDIGTSSFTGFTSSTNSRGEIIVKSGKQTFPYYVSAENYKPFGHPGPKRQYGKGYPGGNFCQINEGKRQAFTNSHSAYALQISYALASGDKLTLKQIDYYMKIILCTHDDNETARGFFAMDTYAEGQGYKEVGRMEGRPLQGLIGGIGITRDSNLRERALYSLSRRFWNSIYVADWEDYPNGVPNKPWRPITYPAWAFTGQHRTLDAAGFPYYTNQIYGVQISQSRNTNIDKYVKNYLDSFRGDFYYRRYLPSRLEISAVAPTLDKTKISSWNAFAVQGGFSHYKQMIYVNPYMRLDTATPFLAPGTVVYSDGSRQTQLVNYQPYRVGIKGDPLDTDKYVRDPFLVTLPTGAVSVEGIPGTSMFSSPDLATTRERQWRGTSRDAWTNSKVFRIAEKNYAQAYQQALLFPYISPTLEMINAYSKIYTARKAAGLSPSFVNRFNDYGVLGDEYQDTYLEIKDYYVRAAKSTIKNSLVRMQSPSIPGLDGRFLMRYFSSPFSAERPFENFTDLENVVTIDVSGNLVGDVPYIGENGLNSGESWPWLPENPSIGLTSTTCKGFQEKRTLFTGIGLVSYLGVVYGELLPRSRDYACYPNTGDTKPPDIISGIYGTNVWALIAIIWAWEILSRYGNQNDSYITQLLADGKTFIEDSLGPEAYDPEKAANSTAIAAHYVRSWGVLGWGSPGNSARFGFNNALGHPEYFPNIDGVLNDHWKDREITNIYLNRLNVIGETTLNSQITVESNFSLVSLSNLRYVGETSLSSQAFSVFPKFVNASVRDYGNDSLTVVDAIRDETSYVYLEVDLFNSNLVGLNLISSELSLTSIAEVSFNGEGSFDLILPKIVDSSTTLSFSTEFLLRDFVSEYSLPNFSHEYSLTLSSGDFNSFIKLGNSLYDFSLQLSSAEFSEIKGLPIIFSGVLSQSLLLNSITITQPSFMGVAEFTVITNAINYQPAFSGESSFNSIFTHVKGSGWGLSPGGSLVGGDDEILSSDSLTQTIRRINEENQILSNRSLYKFETKLWQELTLRTKGDEKVTEIFRDTLEYIINVFSDLVYIDDENNLKQIPCWHGMMDRIVAKKKKEANIILPVMSIYKSSSQGNTNRKKYGTIINFERYWNKLTNRAERVASLPSVPVNIVYRLNVWSKYQEDMDHIAEQIHRMFSPDIDIYTKYNSTTKAFLSKESDEPPTKLRDGENRVLRKSFDITVESHIPSPKFLVTNTGKIVSIVPEYCVPANDGFTPVGS